MRRLHSANAIDWIGRDPAFWLALGAWALVFYGLMRVAQLDLQPAQHSPPILWTLLPGLDRLPILPARTVAWALLSLLLALAIPGLLAPSPIPAVHPLHPECAPLPGLYRLRTLEGIQLAIGIAALLCVIALPLVVTALRAGAIDLQQTLTLLGLLASQPLWIAGLWAALGAPGRTAPRAMVAVTLLALLLTLSIASLILYDTHILQVLERKLGVGFALLRGLAHKLPSGIITINEQNYAFFPRVDLHNPVLWHGWLALLTIQIARIRAEVIRPPLVQSASAPGGPHVSS